MMNLKTNPYLLIFLIIMVVGVILTSIFITKKMENYSDTFNKIELDSYKTSNVIDKAPVGILKKEGYPSVPKTVRFKEFDLIKSSVNVPVSPWFQAEAVNKYDPKFVDVFKTSF